MVAIGILKTGYFLTDAAFVGQLGDEALSAVGGAAFAWWMLLLLGEITGTGVHSLIARNVGAGRSDRNVGVLMQALWLALAIALCAQLLHPFASSYFDLLGFARGSSEHGLGTAYLFASITGAGTFAIHAALGGVFRGMGDTRTILWITAVTVIANAALDPLLIWGWGPVPALGIAGAAWATAAANALGALLAALYLPRLGLRFVRSPPNLSTLRELLAVGLPVSARGIAFAAIYVVLGRMITSFGSHELAAIGVGHRIEGVPYLTSVGFEVGAATLVGQHIGAGDVQGARRACRTALYMCVLAMIPCSIGLFLLAEPLFSMFANEPQTVAAGSLYLRIQTVAFVLMAFESIYEGGFTGLGRTMPAFWIGAIGTGVRLPLAALLAWPLGMGVAGIWWAICLSTIGKGIAMAWVFERHTLPQVQRSQVA
jgi:putative MATE family efflux protein